jgi:hypothetical protein
LKKQLASGFLVALMVILCFLPLYPASAQQDDTYGSGFNISMPVEYVNYTIVPVNGSLWAKIDGTYPMHISGVLPDVLPMVYPTPPQTSNVHMWLDGKELACSNYTEMYPAALHHTAIGDWAMVATVLSPVSEEFTLTIHYEHPVQVVNGSFLFLYDLNITPYLSPENTNSTAYFTVRFETNVTDINGFTTETDTKWVPINYTLTEDGTVNVVSIVMYSEYGKPLLGDLVVGFQNGESVPETSVLALIAVLATVPWILVVAKNRFKRSN